MHQENFIYKTLLISSLLLVFSSSFIFLKENKSLFNINNMLIIGCQFTKEESIKTQLSYLKNKSIISINNKNIKERLLKNQFISEVVISSLLPNTLIINIKEIVPISLLHIGLLTYWSIVLLAAH